MEYSYTIESQPLISFCIPTYNRPQMLLRTLRSIKTTDQDVEIIVTDNSDNNDTQNVVKDLFDSNKINGRYHKNSFPNSFSGTDYMIENFNMGIKLAKGEFVCVIHDDDYLLPGGVNEIINTIKKYRKTYQSFKFGIKLVDKNEKNLRTQVSKKLSYLPPKSALKIILKDSSFVRFPAMVMKKSIYEEVGLFDRTKKGPTDFHMWSRIFSVYGVLQVPQITTAYTIHEQAETMKTFNDENINILNTIFNELKEKQFFTTDEFLSLKSHFFHKYILAGSYRMIKLNHFHEALRIIKLFKLSVLTGLTPTIKWRIVKSVFLTLIHLRLAFSKNSK